MRKKLQILYKWKDLEMNVLFGRECFGRRRRKCCGKNAQKMCERMQKVFVYSHLEPIVTIGYKIQITKDIQSL